MKKILFGILCMFTMFASVKADNLEMNAKSAILMEATTGEVLYELNADEALAPASMTKMMTLLLTMEAIEKGQIALEDNVTVSKNATSMGGSQVYLEENSQYTLDEIIKAVCIASGNDAAVVLAEAIGGSTKNFVDMMNKRAKEMGLTSTNFVNVYGLDADGHLSSARDMAKIAQALIKYELILQYSSIYEDYLQKKDGTNFWLVNTNKLVRFYQGIDGLKTGYTGKAGYCLTVTGKWKGLRLISVVMGEPDKDSRTKDTTELLNYGKGAYKVNIILEKNKSLGTVNVEMGEKLSSEIEIDEDITDLVSTNEEEAKYTYDMKLDKVKAPISKGSKVGTLNVYINGQKFKETPLLIREEIKKASLKTMFKRVFKTMIVGNRA